MQHCGCQSLTFARSARIPRIVMPKQTPDERRAKERTPKGTVAIIDAQFAKQINIAQNGEQRRVTVFEAILHQLWIKQMSGDRRAMRVLLKYREFASIASDNSEFIIFGDLT
jgi:Family of unknown function (DUF5681)